MKKILLVEDDQSLREIYAVRLVEEGYDIVSAGDGEQALAMAIKERPILIISDVMMPKISGFDMLDILRSTTETKDIKVIIMTALSSEDQRSRGEQLGADKYLVKSQVGIEDVVRAVHDVLQDTPGTAPQPTAPAPSQAAPAPAPQPAARPATPVVPQRPQPQVAAPTSAPVVSQAAAMPQPTSNFTTPQPTPAPLPTPVAPAAQPQASTPPVNPAPQPPAPISDAPRPAVQPSTPNSVGSMAKIIQPLPPEETENSLDDLAAKISQELNFSDEPQPNVQSPQPNITPPPPPQPPIPPAA